MHELYLNDSIPFPILLDSFLQNIIPFFEGNESPIHTNGATSAGYMEYFLKAECDEKAVRISHKS